MYKLNKATVSVVVAFLAAMAGYAGSGSDGGKEALGAVGKLIRTETIPGTPESDAVRFYTNAVGFVEINYDEDKAGVLGIFEH